MVKVGAFCARQIAPAPGFITAAPVIKLSSEKCSFKAEIVTCPGSAVCNTKEDWNSNGKATLWQFGTQFLEVHSRIFICRYQ